jgi:hypothetical protein
MTEETKKEDGVSPEKLLIDKANDFQFHAAFLAYSEAFDKRTDFEARRDLNRNIVALEQNVIDYSTFYRNVSQYRAGVGNEQGRRGLFLKTQRKKDWRRATQKSERIRRHKK